MQASYPAQRRAGAICGGAEKVGYAEKGPAGGANEVSRWQTARSASSIVGRIGASSGRKSSPPLPWAAASARAVSQSPSCSSTSPVSTTLSRRGRACSAGSVGLLRVSRLLRLDLLRDREERRGDRGRLGIRLRHRREESGDEEGDQHRQPGPHRDTLPCCLATPLGGRRQRSVSTSPTSPGRVPRSNQGESGRRPWMARPGAHGDDTEEHGDHVQPDPVTLAVGVDVEGADGDAARQVQDRGDGQDGDHPALYPGERLRPAPPRSPEAAAPMGRSGGGGASVAPAHPPRSAGIGPVRRGGRVRGARLRRCDRTEAQLTRSAAGRACTRTSSQDWAVSSQSSFGSRLPTMTMTSWSTSALPQ